MNRNPEYNFTKEIKSKLKPFNSYLQKLGNGENTMRQKMNYAGYFLNWLEKENLHAGETKYNDLLNYINYCRDAGDSKKLINRKLQSIKNYYEHLQSGDETIINPAINIRLKGIRKKLPSGIIAFTELEKLYRGYKTESLRDKRNKIILGLLIYQGITTEELHSLEPVNLKLKEGKICVPGNRKRNSRKLELNPFQILELHEYIIGIRPEILNEINKPKSGRKPTKINKTNLENRLFISINGSENIKSSLLHMFKAIQKINPDIRHAKQIRASVIVHWLKNYNLRQVQYLAGHKYVSSTERYRLNNIDNLQRKIEEFHPLK